MKNSEVITKAKNTLDPANIKAAAAKTYEDVVKTPIAKTQAAMKEMGEQVASLLRVNNGLALEGVSGNSGWRIEMEDTNFNFQRFDGNGDGRGEKAENRENNKFTYKNNPMDNPKASKDIVENPDAVYGFSPNPKSESIGGFADAIDWTNPEQVAEATARRQDYYDKNDNIVELVNKMKNEGNSIEDIAKAVNNQRNQNRLNDYIDDSKGLERVMARNEAKYGNPLGPTAEFLYDKYGSWEKVVEKSMSANPGMDTCCGLYDKYYHLYEIGDR